MSCVTAALVSSPVLSSSQPSSCRSPSLDIENKQPFVHQDRAASSPLLKSPPKSLSPLTLNRRRHSRDENNPPSVLINGLQRSQSGKIKPKDEVSSCRILTELAAGQDCTLSCFNESAFSPPLKRKRPPKLDIPKTVQDSRINGFAEKVVFEENSSFDGGFYGCFSKKGRRKQVMEDTFCVKTSSEDHQQGFFGVFDGHGGRKAADFASKKLGKKILEAIAIGNGDRSQIVQAVRDGYLATDREFLEMGVNSGTCAVTALIKDGSLAVANVGDCRAVLSRNGNADAVTSDHKAGGEAERNRIEKLGGFVDFHGGAWRVQGTLAVSRSIGDSHLKEWVSAEPDIKELQIQPDCEFLILASDGLWEKVSNQEAVDIVRALHIKNENESPRTGNATPLPKARRVSSGGGLAMLMQSQGLNGNLSSREGGMHYNCIKEESKLYGSQKLLAACKELAHLSVSRGSRDDITVMIVDLRHFCRAKDQPTNVQ
eukprot:TRINITY_DN2861_c0_g1_i1.p1 TRINITY_DN2861_c0_g1~~TRINITY_DN2861_c0_g1_i1.p1  ORF type:complete len:485 (+),score=117.17 TRINITY_DN2861_c0_g1_i1:163-1617(+)